MSNNNNKLSVTGKMDTLGANIVGIILATGAALSGVIVNDDCASFSLTIGPNNAFDWLAFCLGAWMLMSSAPAFITAIRWW
jgi:hypothetical protein